MKTLKIILLQVILFLLLQACTQQANWNQYLGPDRNASISGEAILTSWGDKGPKELWSFPLGEGYGGASIYGNEVYILDREKGVSDILRCIDLNTGKEKWNYTYEAKGELPFPDSRAVPTVDKKYIWSVGPHGDFFCFNKKTHEPVWHHNILEAFDTNLPNWGFSQSPLIYENLVIIAPQGKDAGVIAYNKFTGALEWKSRPLTGYNFHVSPALASFGGTDQVLMISPYDRRDSTITHEVVGFDAKTGEELWKYEGLKSFSTIAPPLVVNEELLFLTDCSYNGNYGPVSILLEIKKEGEEFKITERFITEEAGGKLHNGVFYKDHFYLNSTGKPNQLHCLDMDGKSVWKNDSIPGFDLGALILVNNLILDQDGRNGDIYLVEASPDGYRQLGKASFFNSEKSQAWAPLAYSQGKLIIRDLEKMVCVDLQQLGE